MRISKEAFLAQEHKSITLMGMSGVGKTYISHILQGSGWYHFSADYRIGATYLRKEIDDLLYAKALEVPFLAKLLESDSIDIVNRVSIHDLRAVSAYLGKLGNPELDGLALKEFLRRQRLYLCAEIAAAFDLPEFIAKSQQKGHAHFINDSTGSLCEIDDESVFQFLAEKSLIIYIKPTPEDEIKLIERAISYPKPLFYREAFIRDKLVQYMSMNNLEYVALINPDDFIKWIFPELFKSRQPRYERIANTYGYTLYSSDIANVKSADQFMQLIIDKAQ